MIISRLYLRNWRNFPRIDVQVGQRIFLVGPNAAGKSNLLDAVRFLHDIATPGRGGLQQAIAERGGLSKIRCLAARQSPDVGLEIDLSDDIKSPPLWKYALGIKQNPRGDRRPFLAYEKVWKSDKILLDRPNEIPEDKDDPLRLTQTHLENVNSNAEFRAVADFLESVLYVHLVPQLLRHPREFSGPDIPGDPFGRNFLERIAKVPDRTRQSRLNKINKALRTAVPQLKDLTYVIDTEEGGIPHLEAAYEHWRGHDALQREREFSDGTLRLIALMWSVMEGSGPLLLEEPELSLNAAIIRRLPHVMRALMSKRPRQLLVSTHNHELLNDRGIGAEEVLLLSPGREGTEVRRADTIRDIRPLLESGASVAEAVLPRTEPSDIAQMELALQ